MSRRHRAERREITPDAKFGDLVLAKFMNSLMYDGKKSAAEGIIYGAFDTIAAKTKQDPLVVFHEALRNVSPALEVRSRRVGGATYQVPVAENIVYGAFDVLEAKRKDQTALETFHAALDNVAPAVEVRSRRVGGATYQVPVEVRTDRSRALAIRWLITAARGRNEPTMQGRLSGELMDAANNRGSAVKKREDTHKMADANRAFSHYRW